MEAAEFAKKLYEINDKVCAHLESQKKVSAVPNSTFCVYRSEDGCMCAVGALIKEEFYLPAFEGRAAYTEPVLEAVCASQGISYDTGLKHMQAILLADVLCAWQNYHDRKLEFQGYRDWIETGAGYSPENIRDEVKALIERRLNQRVGESKSE